MNRASWKFSYTADKILAAAENKRDFHQSRVNWWTSKRDEIKAKLQTEGVVIDESVIEQAAKHGSPDTVAYMFSNSGGFRGSSVKLDERLSTDLGECVGKVLEHQSKVKNYDAWVQVLESQGQSSFDLNQDDWMFFFGK